MDKASLYVKPGAPKDKKYGLMLGTWDNGFRLEGFEDMNEAYFFCVQAACIDPLAGVPDRFKQWTKIFKSKEETMVEGLPLFEMDEE